MIEADADIVDERYLSGSLPAGQRTRRPPGSRPPRSEKQITDECLLWLRRQPQTYAYKLYTGPLSAETGHPDIDGCVRGRSLKIEMKRPGEKPTTAQMARLVGWREAGALVGWATSLDEVKAIYAHAEDSWVNPLTGPGAPEVATG